jgi:PAS domain S-box-containing protein
MDRWQKAVFGLPRTGQISDEPARLTILTDLAAQLQEVTEEDRIYDVLAHGLLQVVGEDAIINVSHFSPSQGAYASKVLVGLGPFMDKLMHLLGKRPQDLSGEYTDTVKQAMATGRLTRIEDGVVELARNALPPVIIRSATSMLGIEDVYVVGYLRGSAAGGVTIITRQPGVKPPAAVIEAMTMLCAMAVERVRSDERLRRSEVKFRQIIENSNDIIYSLTAAGIFTFVSPAWTRLLGHATADVEGHPFTDFVHPDDLPPCHAFLQNVLETGERQDGVAYRVRHKNGEWRWHTSSASPIRDAAGVVVGYDGIARDITKRRRMEDELREERDRLEHILGITGIGIDVVDGDFNLHFVDRVWQQNYGDPCGRKCYEYFCGLSEPCPDCSIPLALETKKVTVTEEVLTRENNRVIEVHIIPFQNDQGQWLVAEFNVDITERKRAEAEKERLRSQLIQAQKMESVGRLAGGVAHDFNNMLGVILGQTELALLNLGPAEPLHAGLTEIQKAGRHSADLVKQLLAFARKQTVAPKVLDLNDTVEGMLKLLRRLIGEDIELVWKPGHELWPVKIDPVQVDQILANLCVNARDAISGMGRVTIETSMEVFDEETCARHAGFVPGDYVMLAVSDNGCGMSADTLGHLFEPFFTTKALGQGTGLGLASVYGAVKQNNGFVNVYSEPGQGATFKVYLPCHAAGTVPQAKKVNEPNEIRGTETILLVEDDPMILDMADTMLEMLGYTVLAAATPGAAIRMAEEYTGRIDLVMTDVVMPEMNGRDLARTLLTIYPGIKRLFMSGYTANVIAHHGVLDEGVHFIQKPFSMIGLGRRLREVLDQG